MSHHVLLKMLSLSARIVTLLTSEWVFSWMQHYVLFEVPSCRKGIVTLNASKRFFSRMGQHMPIQRLSFSAMIATLFTPERLLSWMFEHVFFEVTSSCTWVFALDANERFFSRMGEHVLLETSWLDACFLTLSAQLSNINHPVGYWAQEAEQFIRLKAGVYKWAQIRFQVNIQFFRYYVSLKLYIWYVLFCQS